MPKFLVETISTHKHQYIVDAEKAEYALDIITMDEADDINQAWLGETIVSIQLIFRAENVLEADPIDAAKQIDALFVQIDKLTQIKDEE